MILTLLWSWWSSPISSRCWPNILSFERYLLFIGKSFKKVNRLMIPPSKTKCFWPVIPFVVIYLATMSTWEAGPSDSFQESCTKELLSLFHQPSHKISTTSQLMCAETLSFVYTTCLWTLGPISLVTLMNKYKNCSKQKQIFLLREMLSFCWTEATQLKLCNTCSIKLTLRLYKILAIFYN